MIKIDRKSTPCPAILTRKGAKELNSNKAKLKLAPKAKLKFKAYSEKDVRDTLTEIFKNKCGYCESYYPHVTPADVEHFRPKSYTGRLGYRKGYKGYYWLAADWDNLLISCPGCNRRMTHEVAGAISPLVIGKEDQFPLFEESKRALRPGKKALESEDKVRKLINPYIEDPETFFVFEDSGPCQGAIKPKPKIRSRKAEMAEASIEVYALHRAELVLARKKHQEMIRYVMTTIIFNLSILATKTTTSLKIKTEAELVANFKKLKGYTDYDQPYSAMAKQMVNKFISDIRTSLPKGIIKL